MNYEQKKSKVAYAVLEASKFVVNPRSNVIIDPYNEVIKGIPANEVKSILMQFEAESLIDIKYTPPFINEFIPDIQKRYLYEVKILDMSFFERFTPHESPIKALNKFTEEITGQTAEERARIKAIENSYPHIENAVRNEGKYFIEYKDDAKIMLDGKIEIGRPQSFQDNQIIFEYLFKHPNETFTKEELMKATKVKITQKFQKIADSLGFRKGLGKAFFDISKTSIRFKNPVKL